VLLKAGKSSFSTLAFPVEERRFRWRVGIGVSNGVSMRLKILVFVLIFLALNAVAAWYVLTRVQVQVFLDPAALAFRIGSQVPAGAADRGATTITPASELPNLGRVIVSNADASRSVRFDRLYHSDDNSVLLVTTTGSTLRFPAMPEGTTLAETRAKASEFEAFLIAEGFRKDPRRLEAGCLRLDDVPAADADARLREAMSTGACGARPATFFLMRMERGSTTVSWSAQPADGAGTYPDPGAVQVSSRVVITSGDPETAD
jgi:hypothetical protein